MFGKSLKMSGNLFELIGKKYLLNGLGGKATTKDGLPDFKSLFQTLYKTGEIKSGQNIAGLLKVGKTGLGISLNDVDSKSLIAMIHGSKTAQTGSGTSKKGNEGDTSIDLAELRELFRQLIDHAKSTGGKIEFQVENESVGKIEVKFDPKTKTLSVYSDNDEILLAQPELLALFDGLDIKQIKIIDIETDQLIAVKEPGLKISPEAGKAINAENSEDEKLAGENKSRSGQMISQKSKGQTDQSPIQAAGKEQDKGMKSSSNLPGQKESV